MRDQLAMFDNPRFDGETYEPAKDQKRLKGQLLRVYNVMLDGEWHTLEWLATACQGSVPSVSARLRDLRKERFGAHTIERKRSETIKGLFLYRMIANTETDNG